MEEDLHKGHRARLREQYLASDGKGFSDHLLLELLLSYAIPRKDVNPLAHRLLNEFGSLERVLGATKSELSGIDGVGPQTVTLLQLVFDLHRRMELRVSFPQKSAPRLNNTDRIARYALTVAAHDRYETLRLFCLDASLRLIRACELSVGSNSSVLTEPRQIIEKAFFYRADSIVLTHNHPSGNVAPSLEDLRINERLNGLAKELGLSISDNLILGERCAYSFRHNRVFFFPSADETTSLDLEEYLAGIRTAESGTPFRSESRA